MKTTIDLHDQLLVRAKRHARKSGRPLRAVVEEGLRRVLSDPEPLKAYVMPDLRTGDPQARNPLDAYSWPELRAAIYDEPGAD